MRVSAAHLQTHTSWPRYRAAANASVQGKETKEVNFNSRCCIMYERKFHTHTRSHHTCTYTYTQVHTCLHLFFGVLGACSWHKARYACHNQSERSAEALAFTADLSELAGLWGLANNKPSSVGDGSPVTQLATRGETWPKGWYEIRHKQTKEERKEARKEGRKGGCPKESFTPVRCHTTSCSSGLPAG